MILKLFKCVLFGPPRFTTMCSTLVPGIIFEKTQHVTHVVSHVSKACCFANSYRFRNVFWAPPMMHFGKRKTNAKRCNITKHYVHRIESIVVVCEFKLLSRPNTVFAEPRAAPMLFSSSRQPPAHCFRRTDGRPTVVFVGPAAAQSVFSSCRRPPQYYFRRADSRPDTISVELAAAPNHR